MMTDTTHTREELAWQDDALCLQSDPELFHMAGAEQIAKSICASCDVREQCLDYALRTHQSDGVWGGMTKTERRNIGRRKKALYLGPCQDCERPRHSSRYRDRTLPEGAVWNGQNHSKGRKLCEECRTARQQAKTQSGGST